MSDTTGAMASGGHQPLTEIREADADARIEAIYQEIRSGAGVAQVNLIFRHLATAPDVLAWAWGALAPAYRGGRVGQAADALIASVPGDGEAALWDEVAGQVSTEDASTLRDVLTFYNRGNPQNLVALTALIIAAERPAGVFPSGADLLREVDLSRLSAGSAASSSLPRLPRRDQLADADVRLIDRLAARQRGGAGVTPSMYLHLGLWPDALRVAGRRLDPLIGTPEFQARVSAVMDSARQIASDLAADLTFPDPRPNAVALQPMLATIQQFTTSTIPEMIVVGAILSGRPARP